MTTPTRRVPASSIDDLVAGAGRREPWRHGDGKSGSSLERLDVDGRPHVLKVIHPDDDWIARAVGDICCLPVQVWTSGLLDQVPPVIDHTVIGAAGGLGRNGWGGALLMRDVSPWLVPEGDTKVPREVHLGFLDHMAALHARFWGFRDGLLPLSARYLFFSDAMIEAERRRGMPAPVPAVAAQGWRRLGAVRHQVVGPLLELRRDPSPLVAALDATPQTLVHGDWKMGNLGWHPEGRTILLDWALPGPAPPTVDLAWYLALNVRRLPQSKDDAIVTYRTALERYGVDTTAWWSRQVDLALLGQVLIIGWEKVLGDDAELRWWLDRAAAGVARL
jgi:Phosphotransferase enzyme family